MREKLNCPNCGAPITGEKCEYCGTLFYDFASIELYKPSYIRIKYNGKLIIFKALPTCINMTQEYPSMRCLETSSTLKYSQLNYPSMKMNVEFQAMPDENEILYKAVEV